jgi:hypothetical protein
LDYSREDLEKFAGKLGILPAGRVLDESLGDVAGGGRHRVMNGQDIECVDRKECEELGIAVEPGYWEAGNGTFVMPRAEYKQAVKKNKRWWQFWK